MSAKDDVFERLIKYDGVFNFRGLYSFCHGFLDEELGLDPDETEYEEKLDGQAKEIKFTWEGSKKLTDYFKFKIKIKFEISQLTKVDIQQGAKKISTNKGSVKIKTVGTIEKDYSDKFSSSSTQMFMRSIYEKWVIPSRVGAMEDKIAGDCADFVNEAKAYLDLEAK